MKTRRQGKVIIERHQDEWFVMLPDGSIEIATDKTQAEGIAKRWFKRDADNDAINVGQIEWRAR